MQLFIFFSLILFGPTRYNYFENKTMYRCIYSWSKINAKNVEI